MQVTGDFDEQQTFKKQNTKLEADPIFFYVSLVNEEEIIFV